MDKYHKERRCLYINKTVGNKLFAVKTLSGYKTYSDLIYDMMRVFLENRNH